ncbi:serine hydrolase domain-containing protein [uncultured Paraglaciecola sp.]|uniref:serine hydrolase domain-containing protein n=1 Tax=uncultured Paraglaciecola sp. TaxID=1765024 RepID=UPI0030DDC5FF|tara:strand:+ start:188832 stop:189848 length:1017 start_codon:yes stop_codon:yes gene_type:complete
MKSIYVFWLVLFSITPMTIEANTLESELNDKVVNIVEQFQIQHGFNGSIALKLQAHPIFTYSVGYQKQNTKLNAEHLFSSGSVGKEFTTVALLKLIDESRLTLDDRISKYIPVLPSWGQKIQVKHLLSHTSGLPKISWKNNITSQDVMNQVMALQALEFNPGTGYLYGNINVMLRAKIVENITGQKFDKYLKDHFFDPLGMTKTIQSVIINQSNQQVAGDYPTAINGVTIYTTASDLLLWEMALLDGKALNGKSVLTYISEHKMSGKPNHIEYDFGQFFMENEKISAIKHDGSNPSHHVLKYTNLASKLSLVVMSSDGNKNLLYLIKDDIEALFQSIN